MNPSDLNLCFEPPERQPYPQCKRFYAREFKHNWLSKYPQGLPDAIDIPVEQEQRNRVGGHQHTKPDPETGAAYLTRLLEFRPEQGSGKEYEKERKASKVSLTVPFA